MVSTSLQLRLVFSCPDANSITAILTHYHSVPLEDSLLIKRLLSQGPVTIQFALDNKISGFRDRE